MFDEIVGGIFAARKAITEIGIARQNNGRASNSADTFTNGGIGDMQASGRGIEECEQFE